MRSKKDLESVIIDTTVQIKNIKHPHDIYLMETAREKIVDLCKRLDIPLNETYANTTKLHKKGLIFILILSFLKV